MTTKYLYTTIAHQRKRIKKIPTYLFKDLDLLYHLMPSNSLALGLYERGISKRTFQHTTGFFLFREEEDVYREETTFCNRRDLESLEYAERK